MFHGKALLKKGPTESAGQRENYTLAIH